MSVISSVCPNIDLNLEHRDIKLLSPSAVTLRQFTSVSYSNSQANFSCPPPSTSIYIDRCIMIAQPFTATFAGTATPPATTLLQRGRVALRAYPIASVTTSAILTLNNYSFTCLVNQLIPYMARFWKQSHFSTYPSYMDTYQQYADGFGANNNPLGTYQDDVFNNQLRGGFPVLITNSTNLAGVISGTIFEPVWIPVLHREFDDGLGFINVKTMDLVINYSANLERIISHSLGGQVTSITVNLGQPVMFLKYSTPPIGHIPRTVTYGSEDLNRFITPLGAPLAPLASITLQSTNIQLNSVPKWILIFARDADANLTASSTDTALNISNISINFDNVTGILSSSNEQQLYKISHSNGLQCTWEQWHGTTTDFSVTGNNGNQIATVGSFLKLYMGKDVSLAPSSYAGKIGAYNLSMNVTLKNPSSSNTMVAPQLYIITSTAQKVILHENGLIESVLGVSGEEGQYMPYKSAMKHYGGSFQDFVTGLKNFFTPINNFLKDSKIISTVSGLIPHPISQAISQGAKTLGYGEDGGMVVGGKAMTRAELLRRVRKL